MASFLVPIMQTQVREADLWFDWLKMRDGISCGHIVPSTIQIRINQPMGVLLPQPIKHPELQERVKDADNEGPVSSPCPSSFSSAHVKRQEVFCFL